MENFSLSFLKSIATKGSERVCGGQDMKDIAINLKNMFVDLFVKMCGRRYYLVVCQAGINSSSGLTECHNFDQLDLHNFMLQAQKELNDCEIPNISNVTELTYTQADRYRTQYNQNHKN